MTTDFRTDHTLARSLKSARSLGRPLACTFLIAASLVRSQPKHTQQLHIETTGQYVAVSSDGSLVAEAANVFDNPASVQVRRVSAAERLWRKPVESVFSIAFSGNGRMLAVGSGGGVVHVYDSATGHELAAHKGLRTDVKRVHFAHGGDTVAGIDGSGRMMAWKSRTGATTFRWDRESYRVLATSYGAGQASLVTASDEQADFWDIATGARLMSSPRNNEHFRTAEYDPDGHRCALSKGDAIEVWDIAARKLATTISLRDKQPACYLAWSADGALLAAASAEGDVQIWDARDWTPIAATVPKDDIGGIQFVAPGNTLAIRRKWHVDFFQVPRAIHVVPLPPDVTAVAANAHTVAAYAHESAGGILRVYDQRTGRLRSEDAIGSPTVDFVALSGDVAEAALVSGSWIRLKDLKHHDELKGLSLPDFARIRVIGAAPSPTRTEIAALYSYNILVIWNTASALVRKTIYLGEVTARNSQAGLIAYSADGRFVALCTRSLGLYVFETQHWSEISHLKPTDTEVTALALSYDGRDVALGFRDGTIGTAKVGATGAIHRQPAHLGEVTSVVFARQSGGVLTAGIDGVIRRLQHVSVTAVAECPGPVSAITYDPGTSRIVATGSAWYAVVDVRP